MRTALVSALALTAALLTGCHTAKPADQRFHRMTVDVPEAPASLAARLRNDAASNGFGVTQNGPFDLSVDFGEQEMRVPVPTEYGLWGTRVSFRDTWVRGGAAYQIAPGPGGGSRVTMSNNPIYYHPDIGVWLPGPYDMSLGADMLQGGGGLQ